MLALAVCLVLGLVCGSAWLALSVPDEAAPEGIGDLLDAEDPGGTCLVPACVVLAQEALDTRVGLREAHAALSHATALDPDAPEPWLLLVEVDALLDGDLDRHGVLEAIERFHPEHEGLDRAHGVVALQEGRLVEARALLERGGSARLSMDLQLATGRSEHLLAMCEAILREDPGDAHACETAAWHLFALGHDAQAEQMVTSCIEAGGPISLAAVSGEIAAWSGRDDVAESRFVAAGVERRAPTPTAAHLALEKALSQNTDAAWKSAVAVAPDSSVVWAERLKAAQGPGLEAALRELEAIDPVRFSLKRGLEAEWARVAVPDWAALLAHTDDAAAVRHLAGLPVKQGPPRWQAASLAEQGRGAEALALSEDATGRVYALLASGRSVDAQAEAIAALDQEQVAIRPLLALAMAGRDDPAPARRAIQVVLGEDPGWFALRRVRYELSLQAPSTP